MTVSETPAGRLRVGADYIEDHFTRRALLDHKRNVCAMGAIAKIWERAEDVILTLPWPESLPPLAQEAVIALGRYLIKTGAAYERQEVLDACGYFGLIEYWNDTDVCCSIEVAAAMRLAANEWEAGQS